MLDKPSTTQSPYQPLSVITLDQWSPKAHIRQLCRYFLGTFHCAKERPWLVCHCPVILLAGPSLAQPFSLPSIERVGQLPHAYPWLQSRKTSLWSRQKQHVLLPVGWSCAFLSQQIGGLPLSSGPVMSFLFLLGMSPVKKHLNMQANYSQREPLSSGHTKMEIVFGPHSALRSGQC